MVRLTVAFAAGIGLGLIGVPIGVAPLVLLAGLVAPMRARGRHDPTSSWVVAVVAGLAAGALEAAPRPCEEVPLGPLEAIGYLEVTPRLGSAPFRMEEQCVSLTAVVPAGDRAAAAGTRMRVEGHVVRGRHRPWLRVRSIESVEDRPRGLSGLARARARWRDALVERAYTVHGTQGGMVAALVLARREGVEPELRDAFAAAGIAHLLAISGFHVGVIWGLTLALLRGAGFARRRAEMTSLVVVWGYVVLIGVPAAAARAGLILTSVAIGRIVNRPATRWAPLSSSALLLLAVDPALLASAGFQLSFAGAAGLTAWAKPWQHQLDRAISIALPRRLPLGTGALVAGTAATLATLPIAAWHFERVSVVGILVTLVATPLVTLALPSAIATIALSFVWPTGAAFLGGGTATFLEALSMLSIHVADLPWATTWIGRPTLLAAGMGCSAALWVARRPGIGARGRRVLTATWVLTGVLAVPLWTHVRTLGTLELRMIDVGQGDALLIRSPAGRYILVDAGRPPEGDPRGHPVIRELRTMGVQRIEWLILTHADADHFGGAEAVLQSVDVGGVLDPAVAVGKPLYLALLERAAGLGIPWRSARAGARYDLDGVRIDILFPSASAVEAVASEVGSPDANEASVILRLTWRGFVAVVTGDAYVDAERAVARAVGDVDVLKVGHHGSRTSSAGDFLAEIEPEWALISVGRGNRYGHPAPDVVKRLEAAGAAVRRTDRDGSVRVTVRRSGSFAVTSER